MDVLHVVILSAIEGITEFLPISSTGHLILASKLLRINVTEFTKTFEIVIQLGAIMSIVVLYFNRFITSLDLYKKLFIAFIPTAVVGFFLYPFIKGYLLGSSSITLLSLFFGGVILILFGKKNQKSEVISYKNAFLIGLFQSISVIPGISRAAATIVGGLVMGLNRKTAVEFSFLLAVPTMFAASLYDLYQSFEVLNSQNLSVLLLGFTLSFLFALVSVKFLLNYVGKNDFKIFGVYRIILAILFWLFVK